MLTRLLRWWYRPLPPPFTAIPPGHAYFCLSCRYVCRGTQAGTCRMCRSEAVYPIRPLLWAQAPSRRQPLLREPPRVLGVEDLNMPLWLTDFRRSTKNGG